nr:MAG TPA: hypothetical protein [Herelleviridae sp.]
MIWMIFKVVTIEVDILMCSSISELHIICK